LTPLYLPEAWRIAGLLGDVATVRTLLAEHSALPLAGWPTQVADRRSGAAVLAALEGDAEAALDGYRAATDIYRSVGWHFFVARLIHDAVRLLGAETVGEELIAEARETFESVGARPYLAWLDEATGNRPAGSPARSLPGVRKVYRTGGDFCNGLRRALGRRLRARPRRRPSRPEAARADPLAPVGRRPLPSSLGLIQDAVRQRRDHSPRLQVGWTQPAAERPTSRQVRRQGVNA
jgi:hypothetical protein